MLEPHVGRVLSTLNIVSKISSRSSAHALIIPRLPNIFHTDKLMRASKTFSDSYVSTLISNSWEVGWSWYQIAECSTFIRVTEENWAQLNKFSSHRFWTKLNTWHGTRKIKNQTHPFAPFFRNRVRIKDAYLSQRTGAGLTLEESVRCQLCQRAKCVRRFSGSSIGALTFWTVCSRLYWWRLTWRLLRKRLPRATESSCRSRNSDFERVELRIDVSKQRK